MDSASHELNAALRRARFTRGPGLPESFGETVMACALAAGPQMVRRALPVMLLLPAAWLLAVATAGLVSSAGSSEPVQPPPLRLYQSAAAEPQIPDLLP